MKPDAQRSALAMLALREHSRLELERKLIAKQQFDHRQIQALLDELQAQDLLSDTRALEAYVRQAISKQWGPDKIRAGAQSKGLVGSDLEALLGEVDWQVVAQAAKAKKFGEPAPGDLKEWQKQARFLASRGFSAEIVYQVLPQQ